LNRLSEAYGIVTRDFTSGYSLADIDTKSVHTIIPLQF